MYTVKRPCLPYNMYCNVDVITGIIILEIGYIISPLMKKITHIKQNW